MPFGYTHTSLRALAKWATQSFFARIHVDGGDEHVPKDGPVIVVANHHNSAVDVSEKSGFFGARRLRGTVLAGCGARCHWLSAACMDSRLVTVLYL